MTVNECFVSTKQVDKGDDTDVMSLLVVALELPSANQLNQSCAKDRSGFLCITELLSVTADCAKP